MSVGCLYVVVCYCMLLAHSYTVRKIQCVGFVCYYLYEANTSYATWTSSRDACKKGGLQMLRIESSQSQAAVDKFLQDLPKNTQREIWIGGQQSNNVTLRYMNGTEFPQQVSPGGSANVHHCVYAKLCKHWQPEYFADNCDEKSSTSRIICEYEVNTMGQCISSDSHLGGKCYRKTLFGGETNKTDWYSGQTYCSQSDIHGDIAYSYLDNNTLINSIISLAGDSKECIQIWLGVRRRIWFWQTDADGDDADRPPIRYFNWSTKSETTSDGNCIYIDRDNGNKWDKAQCNSESLKYFLCMNESDTASTSSTILRSIMNVTTTSEGLDSAIDNTPTNTQSSSTFPPVYIAAVVISVVVLALIIGLTGFFVLKRRRQTAKEHNYVNDGFHLPSVKQQKDDEPEYVDVKMNDDGDVITPYGVNGAVNKSKNEVRHMETASGDLYALSSKQVNKLDKNKNAADVNKNGENAEDLYAKPKKQRNLKPKAPKDGKLNKSGKSRTSLEGRVTSSERNTSRTGLKHTEHFESPSGDVYATVTTE